MTRINIYDDQKTKNPMTLTSDPGLRLRLFIESIISLTILITAFKKKYYQFFFKIKGGPLIVNLILLGKCNLRKVSSHPR